MKNKQFPSKIGWTTEEENFIKHEKQQKKVKGWKTICKQLNEAFPQRQRTGKQCRERYMNFIAYSEQQRLKRDWAPEQDQLLFQKVIYFGTQWSKIIAFLPSRSENNAKNRFYGIMRKISRRITRIEHEMGIKTKKPIKFQALIKYFENGQNGNDNSRMENGITPFCILQIKNKFLEFVTTHDNEINEVILRELINHMHQFNIRNNLKRGDKIQEIQSLQKGHREKSRLILSRHRYTDNASLAQPQVMVFQDKNNKSENIMQSNNRMQNQNFEMEDVQYSFNQDQLRQDYPFKFEKD